MEDKIPAGWTLTDIKCTSAGFPINEKTPIQYGIGIGGDMKNKSNSFVPGDTAVMVPLTDGNIVTCTFTNTYNPEFFGGGNFKFNVAVKGTSVVKASSSSPPFFGGGNFNFSAYNPGKPAVVSAPPQPPNPPPSTLGRIGFLVVNYPLPASGTSANQITTLSTTNIAKQAMPGTFVFNGTYGPFVIKTGLNGIVDGIPPSKDKKELLLTVFPPLPPNLPWGMSIHYDSAGVKNVVMPENGMAPGQGATRAICFAAIKNAILRKQVQFPTPVSADRAMRAASNLLADLLAQAPTPVAEMSIDMQPKEDCGCELDTVPIPVVIKQPSITVVKKTEPATSQAFKFTGGLGSFSLDGDEKTDFPSSMSFTPEKGTYTIRELGDPNYAIKDIVCTENGVGSTFTTNGDSATISLTEDGNVTCTFTNAPLGNVVIKVVAPAGPDQYDFTGGLGSFALDADPSAALQSAKTATLPIGRYVVWPLGAIPADRRLTGVQCGDPSGNSSANFETATSTVQLDPGETVVCTYSYVAPVAPIAAVQEIAVTHPAAGKTGPAALLAMAAGAAGGMSWMRRRRKKTNNV
jgi:hypothetical protein